MGHEKHCPEFPARGDEGVNALPPFHKNLIYFCFYHTIFRNNTIEVEGCTFQKALQEFPGGEDGEREH